MSKEVTERLVCDICSDEVDGNRHYEITLREFSSVNQEYFEPRFIHFCKKHEGEPIPFDTLLQATKPEKED